jgi:hypothetical protein
MADIEWADDPSPANYKYPAMLKSIKAEQLENSKSRERWAFLAEFVSEGTARDLAYRLGKHHDEFDVVSRKGDDGATRVYARLKDEVTE